MVMRSYDIQEVFERANLFLRYCVGLKLTLIELVKLRRCAVDTVNEVYRIKMMHNSFNSAGETAIRFLFMEYGLTILDKQLYLPIIAGYSSEESSQILNWLQEKMHHP